MPWVESASAAFTVRHDARQSGEAGRLLDELEHTREKLSRYFPHPVGPLTVVLHHRPASLALARPQVLAHWAGTAPAARRYVAGWGGPDELHVLSADALAERASAVTGSRQMLALTAPALYARQVVAANNRELASASRAARPALAVRWAWLLDGAARWFVGQTDHARPAIARRLREGGQPSFPPSVRDAPLLGGTVIDLLAREQDAAAAAQLACQLHPGGPRAALSRAFEGRSIAHTEGAWRGHLARLASAA